MHCRARSRFFAVPALTACLGLAFAASTFAKDVAGSVDHPMFPTRMPGYEISLYKQTDFDTHAFPTQEGKVTVEGRKTSFHYRLGPGGTHPGVLGIQKNYEDAVVAAGGQVVARIDKTSVLKLTGKDGTEAWAEVNASVGNTYKLTIVERAAMAQVIRADAMLAALDRDGFIALEILFETAKADIKPESQPQIDQVAALLKGNPNLKVGVEGHTDDVGTTESNKALSEARAKSVVAALVAQGVTAARLRPAGFGEEKPVADNRTEEGRKKNRRVELVKAK